MPVQIGVRAHDFTDPTGLLTDCHRRIEMFLGSLEAVAKVVDRPVSDEVRNTLLSALHYFRESAPKHNADEEESLFPRLRNVNHPDAQGAVAKIDELEKDHQWAAPLHEEVERLGQCYLSNGILTTAEAERFRSAVARLQAMYREHIHVEDDLVFPAAARLLSQTDQAAIAKEMAARRKVSVVTETRGNAGEHHHRSLKQ